jgi:hypothetical protein
MNHLKSRLSGCLLGIAALAVGGFPAFAAEAPSLGAASGFAVLSAAPDSGGAVTCTDSTITGDVGSSGAEASIVQTNCVIDGAVVAPVSEEVVTAFNSAYDELALAQCDEVLTTLDAQTLSPGVYCFDAAATSTGGVLTLVGSSDGIWIFRIGTLGTGALTGTNFTVVAANGADACNVYWWVAEAATMTDSDFKGTILAGAGITITGGIFEGDAMAKAGVTLSGADATGCDNAVVEPPKPPKQRCDQGVGNGPEGCDPGNSNQGNPFRSNDELGGTPGNPGKRGGNR